MGYGMAGQGVVLPPVCLRPGERIVCWVEQDVLYIEIHRGGVIVRAAVGVDAVGRTPAEVARFARLYLDARLRDHDEADAAKPR
ncbi:MAG: hypothetical protein KatS3mg109_0414 [Pirellulaceae bacterium]|nr:MAG: hypothetical protein KatS3mg109_0414 [Pirellulaceae bacterium]